MFISESNLAALTGTSTSVVRGWAEKSRYPSKVDDKGIRGFDMSDLNDIDEVREINNSIWEEEENIVPSRQYNSVELFAGGGGLALGMEKAGFHHVLLNEFDRSACNTLRVNRPRWNVIEGDVRHVDFTLLKGKVDFLSGGFPCQAFSFAGKQGGFNDVRGTLFFELARAVKEIQPRVFMCENVKGLVSHDDGKTFNTICHVIDELGYVLIPPRVLKAIMYMVPQKRERIILIAVRKDLARGVGFIWPSPYKRVLTLADALYKGVLYDRNVPSSEGAAYPAGKKSVLSMVPQGGDWRDLPEDVAKRYMGGSWNLGGGKTGMARRLSLEEPSLTLTCSPAQKQTERCHPLETRPLSIREYARIQTFPDDWSFQGTMSDKYKQIGNAVPVNLAWAVGRAIIRMMNEIEISHPSETIDCTKEIKQMVSDSEKLIVKKNNKTQTSEIVKGYKQLNILDLLDGYSAEPVILFEQSDKDVHTYDRFELNESAEKNALMAYVRPDVQMKFISGESRVYYSGKRFPATVSFKDLKFFIPYIKGKGIRDVYKIRSIRVGMKPDKTQSNDMDDLRLIFDIVHAGRLKDDFIKVDLKIWRTYGFTNIKSNGDK